MHVSLLSRMQSGEMLCVYLVKHSEQWWRRQSLPTRKIGIEYYSY